MSPPDPLTTYLGTAALERLSDLIAGRVMRRWSDFRARRFVEEFVEAVRRRHEAEDVDIETMLEQVLEDEDKSAALYEAFRHVLFSASRELGPVVIALHMAEVVAGLVKDPEVSDSVLHSASLMTDADFAAFASYAAAHGLEPTDFTESTETITTIPVDRIDFDPNWRRGRTAAGLLVVRVEVGAWAEKLERTGLLVQDISEEKFAYAADSERYVDEPGTVRRVFRNIELREGVSHLLRLTKHAQGLHEQSNRASKR